jgi:branched-chain amino acid transport system ATP-binding protein
LLKVRNITVGYNKIEVLHEVSVDVKEGEIISVIGANASGKSTILKTISGLVSIVSGAIEFEGINIDRMTPNEITSLGIIQVPEGRKIFPFMTVQENLEVGAHVKRSRIKRKETLDRMFAVFPILYERRSQIAGSLSGGEQQMLAISRGLMGLPKLLMLDEPSLGLAPLLVMHIFEIIQRINREGITMILVEQNVSHALRLSQRGYVLENGRITIEGSGEKLLQNANLRKAYMGL